MKTLTVSIKSSHEVLQNFSKAFKAVSQKKMKGTHFEVSFDNKKNFDRFVKNIGILSLISKLKPNSVYELAKLADMDVSNLNKIILFFEKAGVIKVIRTKVAGRTVAKPIVEYDKIEFDLKAA
jgi:predicted transcriptional regulator